MTNNQEPKMVGKLNVNKATVDGQPYDAFALGECPICEVAFLGNKSELLVHVKERSNFGPFTWMCHAKCAYPIDELFPLRAEIARKQASGELEAPPSER